MYLLMRKCRNVKYVVIPNRSISKMVAQVGRKQALFGFCFDILPYNEDDCAAFENKERYIIGPCREKANAKDRRVGDFLQTALFKLCFLCYNTSIIAHTI